MARAYSQDLRDWVIDDVSSGKGSMQSAARHFGVSPAAAIKWMQHYERSGSRCDRGTGGHQPSPVRQHRIWLLSHVHANSSLTLRSLCDRLQAEQGVRTVPSILSRFFKAEGISFKKSVLTAEQDRPDVACKRERWKRHQRQFDPGRLVFIDETWVKTNMIRTHGWGPRGQRVRDKAPHEHWKTLTFLAALRHDRIDASCVLDGPVNSPRFQAYVEQVLVPTLAAGDVVILDNLGSHKSQAARRATRKVGVHLLFLPSYSPDLNPIEQVFAKIKILLRKACKRTVEATWRHIGALLDNFTPEECANYLRDSGYAHTSST